MTLYFESIIEEPQNMDTIKEALKILEKDKINNVSFINFIKNNQIISVDILNEAILCRGKSDRKWIYIYCKNKDELCKIKEMLNVNDSNFAAVEEWIVPKLTEGKEIMWDLSAVQYYLPNEIEIKPNKNKTVQLIEKDANIVYKYSTYQNYINIDYVKERIQKGISAGFYEGDKLVSWSITQDDGAIGFLHTIKDFRRKGYGKDIMLYMIDKLREIGELPFAYAEESNKESKNILSKLGFKKNKKVHWFQIK